MSITTNRYRPSTGERLATFKLTVHLDAEQLATAVLSHEVMDGTAPVITEAGIRRAVEALFFDGLETASYRVGDNLTEDVIAAVEDTIAVQVFDGRRHATDAERGI